MFSASVLYHKKEKIKGVAKILSVLYDVGINKKAKEHMKLKEYLEREKIPASVLARHLECHPQTVRGYIHGTRFPSYAAAKAIEDYTQNEVTVQDLLEDKPIPPRCPTCHRIMWGKKVKKDLGKNKS